MIRPVKAPGFIFAAVLLLSGCSRVDETEIAAQVGESHARTVSTLAELPPELRRHLLDRFDWRQDRRTVPAESRAVREREIITDERRWFEPTCTLSSGYSHTLFVGAMEVGRFWVIQYQFGGIAHGGALLVVSRDDTGSYRELDQVYLRGLKARPEEIVAALARAQKAPR